MTRFWILRAAWLVTGQLAAVRAGAQALTLCSDTSYGPNAFCGTIAVPENRGATRSRLLTIHFAVLRARVQPAREAVVVLAGGPGDGGTALVGLGRGMLDPVRETKDLLFVDQRGTGQSNPLICDEDVLSHPELAFGHVFDPPFYRDCHTRFLTHADLRFYSTEIAALDFGEVRKHLGYEKLTLFGLSYGTRMAQAIAKAFPNDVRAIVLDGVVPFDLAAPSDYAHSAQLALDRLFADCEAQAACVTNYPKLRQQFANLLRRFDAGPVRATVRRDSVRVSVPFSRGDFGYAVRGLMYRARRARELPAMIAHADSSGTLDAFAQAYWQREADFGGFANGLHMSVYCTEDTQQMIPARFAASNRGTFLGDYLTTEYSTVCRGWTKAALSPTALAPLRGSIPTLLVSGWFDPVTPLMYGDRVAKHLSRAVHVVVRNEAHGASFGCASKAVLHVLTHGSLNDLPAVCEGVRSLWDGTVR